VYYLFNCILPIILAFMSCPAHIEIIGEEKNVEIAKEKDSAPVKVSRKRAAQLRAVKSGGGVTA
jgi:hypothetical protein